MSRALHRSIQLSLLAALSAGCSAIRFDPEPESAPAPSRPRLVSLDGSWGGVWEIEGQRIEGTLVLRQDGSDLEATFASPTLGGTATGEGSLEDDGQVELDLAYNIACPGTARLTGSLQGQGSRLGGALIATDCTGKANGTFSFTRR
jgi:hypothetical protein